MSRRCRFYRLQQTIMDKLVNGEWQAGKQLPSERQFAQTTGFSVGTVRKALENMVHQGYLVRIQGKGTYVTKSIIDKNAVKYYRLRRNRRTGCLVARRASFHGGGSARGRDG